MLLETITHFNLKNPKDGAFIQYKNEYMGCILNWPGVFTKSNCTICEC